VDPVTKYRLSNEGLLLVQPTGSGKTRVAIQATQGGSTTVVGPASITKNFENEENKAYGRTTKRNVTTFNMTARGNKLPGGENLVIDEAHNIRNPETKAFHGLAGERSKYHKALLMTASPIVNEPYDIVPQINMVAGKEVLPSNKKDFYGRYYKEVSIDPGFINKLRGVTPGSIQILRDPEGLRRATSRYTHVADTREFEKYLPKRQEEIVKVPMSRLQEDYYKYLENKVPPSLRYKIKSGLPPSKAESSNLNAYLTGLRQVTNTNSPFTNDPQLVRHPKIDRIVQDLNKEVSSGGKVLVYSNFLDAGLNSIKRQLVSKGIRYNEVVGDMSKSIRDKQVAQYNTDKSKVMLISGAGAEGLNLPKTTLIQLTEPHWNKARLYQAASRGIRRGDDPNRTVKVRTYLSTFADRRPELLGYRLGFKPQKSADEYLYDISERKNRQSQELLRALKS
jgi:SNF2 family DNA or RNA helicase